MSYLYALNWTSMSHCGAGSIHIYIIAAGSCNKASSFVKFYLVRFSDDRKMKLLTDAIDDANSVIAKFNVNYKCTNRAH